MCLFKKNSRQSNSIHLDTDIFINKLGSELQVYFRIDSMWILRKILQVNQLREFQYQMDSQPQDYISKSIVLIGHWQNNINY